MVWNKMKRQLEGFLTPSLVGKIEYRASGYRYTKNKPSHCFITIDKVEAFSMTEVSLGIPWYQTEQEIKSDTKIILPMTKEDIDVVREKSGNKIPEERLKIVTASHKMATYAKEVLLAQQQMQKTDFQKIANTFLTTPVEVSLASDEILLNVLAIIDRRVGKKRLQNMRDFIALKHPVVQYFYHLRMNTKINS